MYIPIPLTDEHDAMSDTLRQLLDRYVTVSDVRSVLDIGRDGIGSSEIWRHAVSIGLPGVTIPEDYEGMGGSALDTFVAFRAWGRAVHPSPLFSSIAMAAPAVLHAGDAAAQSQYLPALASGSSLATLAVFEDDTRWEPGALRTVATPLRDGVYGLTGDKHYVLDLPSADIVLVVARADFGLGLFAVDRDSPGLVEEPLTGLDLTRTISHLRLEDVESRLVSPAADRTEELTEALRVSTLALVADSVGGAEAVLDMAVDYAKVREQFGRPIGAFQAIKHKLAELTVTVEGMISAGWAAAEALETKNPDTDNALLLAKIYCGQNYFSVTRANIQVHGGIGFTWEHPAHLYFRRAMTNSMLLGDNESDRSELYSRLVGAIGDRS